MYGIRCQKCRIFCECVEKTGRGLCPAALFVFFAAAARAGIVTADVRAGVTDRLRRRSCGRRRTVSGLRGGLSRQRHG